MSFQDFFPITFGRPVAFGLLAFLPFLWFGQRKSFRLPLVLRSCVFLLLLLALADIRWVRREASLPPILALDVSRSITLSQKEWMVETVSRSFHPTPSTPVILFAGNWQSARWEDAMKGRLPPDLRPEETNLEALLLSVEEPKDGSHGEIRSLYLFTDGWETSGHVTSLFPRLAQGDIRVFPFSLPPPHFANIAVQRLTVPTTAPAGSSVNVSVTIGNFHRRSVAGELILQRENEHVVRQSITVPPGSHLFTFPVPLAGEGLLPVTASFRPVFPDDDDFSADNEAKAWVAVKATEKVLVISGRNRDRRYLGRVLTDRGISVTAVDMETRPSSLPPLTDFHAVILNNVAREKLPAAFLEALEEYIRQGGGFIMVGGEESFGLGGYKDTPVEKVLPVALKPPQREKPRTAVVLVIDKSGSMRIEHKLLYAREAAKTVAHNLSDDDLLGVIGFDAVPFVVVPLDYLGKSRERVAFLIDRLKPSGGTFLMPALVEAKRQLERQFAHRKHVIVLTDGETGGSGSTYLDLVAAMRQELDITITAIAVGDRPNLRLLSRIAQYGGGAFHHTYDPTTLPDLFLGDIEEAKKEKTMVEKEVTPIAKKDSPLLAGLEGSPLPPLKGYVETVIKKDARLDADLPREGRRDPLLASWTYGQGKTVAFTADASGRWSAPWVTWNSFGKFWTNVVRWTLPPREKTADFSVEVGYANGTMTLDLFRYGEDSSDGAFSAAIEGPESAHLALERIAPGHYRGSFPTAHPGDYRIRLAAPAGKALPPVGFTLSSSAIAETPQLQPNIPLLEHLARLSGGALNPSPELLTAEQPQRTVATAVPLLPLIAAAMAIYLLELIVRKIR